MQIEIIVYGIVLVWGIGTTIYGLYLSRRNNRVYNEQIVSLLKDIKEALKNEKNIKKR